MGAKPPKNKDVVRLAQALLDKGLYIISAHAKQRQEERRITLGDIKKVIQTGQHNEKKDQHTAQYNAWNYAIEGLTLEERKARICVAFEEELHMVIITVIDIGRKK